MKHQLNIHLDYQPGGALEVRYGYHYSGQHQLREQVLSIPGPMISADLRLDLDDLYEALRGRAPAPEIVRRVYLERPEWSLAELPICDRAREAVRKLAWQDYERLLGHHLFGPAEEGP